MKSSLIILYIRYMKALFTVYKVYMGAWWCEGFISRVMMWDNNYSTLDSRMYQDVEESEFNMLVVKNIRPALFVDSLPAFRPAEVA